MSHIICSIFGDSNTNCADKKYSVIKDTVGKLIVENGVNTFLFGSQSEFELLCLKAVSELKNIYPSIQCFYVRYTYKYVDDEQKDFVKKNFDDTFCPFDPDIRKCVRYMIDNSEFCVFYYNHAFERKSNVKIAYGYAHRRKKRIVNLYSE